MKNKIIDILDIRKSQLEDISDVGETLYLKIETDGIPLERLLEVKDLIGGKGLEFWAETKTEYRYPAGPNISDSYERPILGIRIRY